jgi:preprotein translocase subunit Sss1
VLLTALLLRSGGLGRDFPSAFHCDVPKQLHVIKNQVENGDFFNYNAGYPIGHQQITYLVLSATEGLRAWFGMASGPSEQEYFLTGRIVGLAFGLAGILGLMLAGRRLMGMWAGLLAGLLLALDEFHIVHSHHAMGDIPQAAMTLLAFWACTRIFQANRLGNSLLAGLFIGMAAAIKYYGGYLGLAYLAAHFLADRRNWPALGLGILAGVVGFLILTPSFFVDPWFWFKKFYSEYQVQSNTSAMSGNYGISHFISGWTISWSQWRESSLILPYLLIPALVLMFFKRQRKDWLILSAALASLFIINFMRVVCLKDSDQVAQVGFMCLVVVRGIGLAAPRLSFKPRAALYLGTALLVGLQAWHSIELSYTMRLPDTRYLAQKWLERRLPPAPHAGIKVGIDHWQIKARTDGKSDTLYALGKGYDQIRVNGKGSGPVTSFLRGDAKGKPAFVLLHSFIAHGTMDELDQTAPAEKEFHLIWRSWQNPAIQIRDPNQQSLNIPFRVRYLTPAGWPRYDFASTPFSLREPRQAILEAGDHEFTLFSKRPLEHFTFMIRGNGRTTLEHAGEQVSLEARPTEYQIREIEAECGFPYFAFSYKIRIRTEGRVMASLALSQPERAAAYYLAGNAERARQIWQQALEAEASLLPQDQVRLAALDRKQGQSGDAGKILAGLGKQFPGFWDALKTAARTASQKEAAVSLARALKVPPHTLTFDVFEKSLSRTGSTKGKTVEDPVLKRPVHQVPAGEPSESKFWSDALVSQDWLWARFWMRADPGPFEELGIVDLFAHVNGRPHSDLPSTPIVSAGGPDYFPVDLRVKAVNLPMVVEFRVKSNGKRRLWLDRVELRPDLIGWAKDALEPR